MRNKLTSVALILVIGLLLFPIFAEAKTTITYWTWWGGMDQAIQGFEESHPDIDVQIVQMGPWDLHDKFLICLASGVGAPDVVQLVLRRFDAYTRTGQLADLTEHLKDLEGSYAAPLWKQTEYEGKSFGLPTDVGPAVVFYRADVFEELGIETPIETWEEFLEIGKKVSDGSRFMLPVFAPSGEWGVANFFMYLQSRGGNIYTEDGQLIKDNPLLYDTLEWYYSLVKDGIGYPVPFFTPQFWAAFQNDKLLALPIHIPEGKANLRKFAPDQSGKWSVMPWPKWDAEAPAVTGNWGGNVLAVPAQSKNVDAAVEFIRWMAASNQGQLMVYNTLGGWPSYQPVLEEPDFAKADSYFSDTVFADELLPYPDFRFFDEARTTQIIGKELDDLFAGEIDVDKAYNNIIGNIARELGR